MFSGTGSTGRDGTVLGYVLCLPVALVVTCRCTSARTKFSTHTAGCSRPIDVPGVKGLLGGGCFLWV